MPRIGRAQRARHGLEKSLSRRRRKPVLRADSIFQLLVDFLQQTLAGF
jgi:hypothetical protein